MKISICVTLKDLPDWHTNWSSLIIRGHSSLCFLFTQGEKNLKKSHWTKHIQNSMLGGQVAVTCTSWSISKKTDSERASLKTRRQTSSEGTSRCWMSTYIPKRDSALFLKVSWKKTFPWIKPKLEQDFGPRPENSEQFCFIHPPFLPVVSLVSTVHFQLCQVFWKLNHRTSTDAEEIRDILWSALQRQPQILKVWFILIKIYESPPKLFLHFQYIAL